MQGIYAPFPCLHTGTKITAHTVPNMRLIVEHIFSMSVSLRSEVSMLLMFTSSSGIATAQFMVKPVSHKFCIYRNER
jgi:hypothetical protein